MTGDRAVIRLGVAEEQSYGYAQAIRVGDLVLVAGRTGVQAFVEIKCGADVPAGRQ